MRLRSEPTLIDHVLLEQFRGRNPVILSPHFDDACFSLGEFLFRLGRGDLVNIFTHGNYFARTRRWNRSPAEQDVFKVRDAEDAAFAARCGLTRHDLGCEEPSLLGRRPTGQRQLEDDVRTITQPVLALLQSLARRLPAGTRGMLLAPLGAGRHVNHRATHTMVMGQRAAIEADYDIYFYEDLPYARGLLNRQMALRRAGGALGTRFALPTDWAVKKALVECYPSQLRGRAAPGDYWPGALRPFAPHEAFWSLAGA